MTKETTTYDNMPCALCKTPLTDSNATKEHIFPNAIGGRRKVNWFICIDCNSRTGNKWDAELVRHLRPFCTLLGVKRSSGANQPFAVEGIDGKGLRYHPDGSMSLAKPVCEIKELDGKIKVNIKARTFKELESMIPGIVKKHPKLSRDKLLQLATRSKEPSSWFRGELTFGGVEAGKSVIKTCLAMLYRCGLDIDQCEHAQSYLFEDGEPCFGYFNMRDLVRNRPRQSFFHCVWIRGDSLQKQIVAYVEYFGVYRIIACLSSKYAGADFSCGYAIDPVTGKDLGLEVDIDISSDEIRRIYDYEMIASDITQTAVGALLDTWVELDRQRAKNNAINHAINHALSECGVPSIDMLTSENTLKFCAVVAKSFTKWAFPELRD